MTTSACTELPEGDTTRNEPTHNRHELEAAVWGAFRSVFPATTLPGCSFHWGQAVWRQIQDDGLGPTYRRKKNICKFLREILCLPFLPAEQIPATFKDFCDLVLPTHPEQ